MHPAKKEKSNNMLTTFLVTEVEHYIELVFCLFSFWLLFEMYVFKYFKIPLIITSEKNLKKKDDGFDVTTFCP